jgi:RNA polymerase sigma factor (sigma-70 family)
MAAAEMPGPSVASGHDRVAGAYAAEAARLIALGRLLCGDAQAGEDLAHDVFVDAVRRTRRDPAYLREPVWPWLRVALVRRAMRWRARRVSEMRALVRLGVAVPTDEAWSDGVVDLVRAVRRLPPRMRACVTLFYVEDMSVQQIAEALDCAPRTVETQLRSGRGRLASLLDGEADQAREERS